MEKEWIGAPHWSKLSSRRCSGDVGDDGADDDAEDADDDNNDDDDEKSNK